MTVLLLTWVTGCGSDPADPGSPPPDVPALAPGGAVVPGVPTEAAPDAAAPAPGAAARPVQLVLERGQFEDGWVSVPGPDDVLASPPAMGEPPDATGTRRWRAVLPVGAGVARVNRAGCGPVEVPYTVGAVPIVVLPYPTCATPDAPMVPGRSVRLDRHEHPWAALDGLHAVELFQDVPAAPPGQEDGPARYVTFAEARAICAWSGGRLPTRAEWDAARAGSTGTPIANATRDRFGSTPVGDLARTLAGVAPRVGPAGHLDLEGNVEEWLVDATVAGGSYVSLPDELGITRDVPASARSETIGFRCAWDP